MSSRLASALGLLTLLFLLTAPRDARARTILDRRAGLPSAGVTALAWDGAALWIGTTGGLATLRDGTIRAIEHPLESPEISALLADGETIWIAGPDGVAQRGADGWRRWTRGDEGLDAALFTALAARDGVIHAASYGGGLHRRDEAGWVRLGPGGPARIVALLDRPEGLYAATPRGLWRWDGAGWTWDESLGAIPLHALAAHDGALYTGSDEGLLRLEPLGSVGGWSPLHPTDPVRALASTPEGLAVGTDAGVWLGDDAVPSGPGGTPLRASGAVRALTWDAGRLWVGTAGTGLAAWPEIEVRAARRLPVVLIHGLDDGADRDRGALRFLVDWLEADGYPVTMLEYEATRPFMEQVAELRRAVARAGGGERPVVLIGHSYGGLLARAYAASALAGEIAGLSTLGTPNAGVRLVYDFVVDELDGRPTPARVALLPEHVTHLARYAPGTELAQLHVGGEILPRDALLQGFPPSDGLITAASATAAPGATRIEPLAHGWTLTGFELAIPSLIWPDTLYRATLLPWLSSLPGTLAADTAPPLALPAPGQSRRPLLDAILGPGEATEVPVTLGEAPVSWLLAGEGLEMTLRAPDGTRYLPDRLLLTERIAHLPAQEQLLPLDLWGTRGPAGEWVATVRNPGDRPVEARLALVEPGAPALEVALTEPWVEPGAPVEIVARAPAGAPLIATLDGAERALDEVAPGRYVGVLGAPSRAGYHALRVRGAGLERLAVVGVRSSALAIGEIGLERRAARATLEIEVIGEGSLTLGLEWVGEDGTVVGTRLLGPFRLRDPRTHHVRVGLALPSGTQPIALRIEFFDSRGALVPVAPPTEVELAP